MLPPTLNSNSTERKTWGDRQKEVKICFIFNEGYTEESGIDVWSGDTSWYPHIASNSWHGSQGPQYTSDILLYSDALVQSPPLESGPDK